MSELRRLDQSDSVYGQGDYVIVFYASCGLYFRFQFVCANVQPCVYDGGGGGGVMMMEVVVREVVEC